jgi:hypothetical protein
MNILHSVQTGPGAHSTSYPIDIGGLFPLGQRSIGVKLTTCFRTVKRRKMVELCLPSSIHLHGLVLSQLSTRISLSHLALPSEEKYISHTGNIIVLIILMNVPKRLQLFAAFPGKAQSQWTQDAEPNPRGFLMFVSMAQFEIKFGTFFICLDFHFA